MYQRTIEELQKDEREKVIIDIRREADFLRETYPGAKHIYWEEFEAHKDEVPKDRPVYLICYTGERSDELARELLEEGYEVYSVQGGYRAYLRMKLLESMEQTKAPDAGEKNADRCSEIERSIIKKFRKEIWRKFTKAINEYELIQDGDKIAVCISGGKDSMLMAKLFQELERHGKKNFEVVFLVMNPGYNEINYETIVNNAKILNVPITVFTSEIFDIVAGEEESPCYLCARMRRGHLYSKAKELGCNKIALGHHFDDAVQTFMLNLFYEGRVGCFSPVTYLDRTDITVLRPLVYAPEKDIEYFARHTELPVIKSSCPANKKTEREEMKKLLSEIEKDNKGLRHRIFGAMQRGHISGFKESKIKNYDDENA